MPLRTHAQPRTYIIRESSGSWLVEATWWTFDRRGEEYEVEALIGDYPTEAEAHTAVLALQENRLA